MENSICHQNLVLKRKVYHPILLLVVCFLPLIWTSCGDDDNDPNDAQTATHNYFPSTADDYWIYEIITEEEDTSSLFIYMTPNDSTLLGKSFRVSQENGTTDQFFTREEDGQYFSIVETLDMSAVYESNFLRAEAAVGDQWEELFGEESRIVHEVLAVDEEKFVGSEFFRNIIRMRDSYYAMDSEGIFQKLFESERSYSDNVGLVESIDVAIVGQGEDSFEIRSVQSITEYSVLD